MKAIFLAKYGSPGDLEFREVEQPHPGPDDVLIRVHASTINDWDWCLIRGKPFYIRFLCGLLVPKVNIPGAEVAGVVAGVGKNVTKFRPRDEVYGDLSECGFGGWAEYVCAPENALVLKPASMSFVQAAAMPHAATLALQGLRDYGNMRAGQKLLINGAGGGVGTLGLQMARSIGIDQITGVDASCKFEMMRSLGFRSLIDYTVEDFTNGIQRYDLILDTKTNRSIFKYLRALAPDGTYVTVGGTTARLFQALLAGPFVRRLSSRTIRIVALKPNRDLDYINGLFESGKIKPVIDGPFKLEEVPKAVESFGQGRHIGKIVIAMDPTAGGPAAQRPGNLKYE